MKKFSSLFLSLAFALVGMSLFAQSPNPGPSSSPRNYTFTNPASNQINWLRDFSESIRQSQATGKPILILFTGTNWCPACMKLEREVLTKPEFAQALSNQFVFLKAEFTKYSEEEVQRSPYKQLLDRYQISSFPTMVIVNHNGERVTAPIKYQPGGSQFYIQQLRQRLNEYVQMRQTAIH